MGNPKSREDAAVAIDAAYLRHQRTWSDETFGPGRRTEGVIDHIRKELVEVEQASTKGGERLAEWMDVVILALDGATREARALGLDAAVVLDDVADKQARNERREWPDWRTQPEGQAIEHVRSQPLCQQVIDHPRFGPMKCLAPMPCNHGDPRYFRSDYDTDDGHLGSTREQDS